MSKIEGGKASGSCLHQAGGSCLHGSCDCSIVVLRLGEFQRTGVVHALSRSIRERGTDASAVTRGA